jgi:hypothetical protein
MEKAKTLKTNIGGIRVVELGRLLYEIAKLIGKYNNANVLDIYYICGYAEFLALDDFQKMCVSV